MSTVLSHDTAVALTRWLDTILGDTPRHLFTNRHLGRSFIPLPGRDDRFDGLLNWQALNGILESHEFTPNTIRMMKDGEDVPQSRYLKPFARSPRPFIVTELQPV